MFYLAKIVASIVIGSSDLIELVAILYKIADADKKILVFSYSLSMKINCKFCLVVITVSFIGLLILNRNIGVNTYRLQGYLIDRLAINWMVF